MIDTTAATGASAPVAIADHRSTAITPRGHAVLRLLEVQDLVRALDRADRDYVAPLIADILVDVATDLPPTA